MYLASGLIHKNSGNRINFIASREGLATFFSSLLCSIVNARRALLVQWRGSLSSTGQGVVLNKNSMEADAQKNQGMNYCGELGKQYWLLALLIIKRFAQIVAEVYNFTFNFDLNLRSFLVFPEEKSYPGPSLPHFQGWLIEKQHGVVCHTAVSHGWK